ncbi:shikimate dehydrogenase [Sodalis ligni]|jgi:shikimate dehydrogenase|uniref:Shikimate dehydrogenase n=1 Tax=Sodalis ligni TaxID=2697027 RepID=A0A4R1NEV6_9GAMM|nr:shikimate dehydrogenase [Sodalis ligni]QWA12345.1 shikimate dehydrogenase [Sodalis ligni]TCL04241.1 shikimate dehydrogenase [Sodalis ligni]
MENAIVDGSTRLFGIVGDPVTQVKTPQLMTAIFRAQGINALLLPFQVAQEGFEAAMRGLMSLRNLDGLVITVPHKVRACGLVDSLSPRADQVGAINVMRRLPDGTWYGDMFDGEGLVRGMQKQGFSIEGKRIKQLGAGGGGSAVAVALAAAGADTITLCDPRQSLAQGLASRINRFYPRRPAGVTADSAGTEGYDLLVNCSPVGMRPGDGMPAPFGEFDPSLGVVDIIMHPEETPLLAHARRCGCRAMNGKPMIEGQLESFCNFFAIRQP